MSELGATLTTTGLIATVVAVFFGVAALYVSQRRRAQVVANGEPKRSATTPAPVPPVAERTHAADTRPLAEQPRTVNTRPAGATATRSAEPLTDPVASGNGEVNPLWARSIFSTGQTGSPLFERLGTRKEDPPVAPSPAGKGREYRWD